MPKEKVYELAKKLGRESKEIINRLAEMGIEGKKAGSGLEEEQVKQISDFYARTEKQTQQNEQIKNGQPKTEQTKAEPKQNQATGNRTPQAAQTKQQQTARTPQTAQTKPPRQAARPTQTAQSKPPQQTARPPQTVQPKPPQQAARPTQTAQSAQPKQQQGARPAQTAQAKPQQQAARPPQATQAKPQQQAARPTQTVQPKPQQQTARPAQPKQQQKQSKQNKSQPKTKESPKNPSDISVETQSVETKSQQKAKAQAQPQAQLQPVIEEPRIIKIQKNISIKELAVHLEVSGTELIKTLMKKGKMVNLNQDINFQEAADLAENYNVILEEQEEEDILREAFKEDDEDDEKDLTERPPVVVVMGHVDHGKTSLLDAIREANVTKSEAGGITQHIGAYTVSIDGKPITFLDTPGHEAFTAMRMRGAQVTDIAVLVVAADDGVMPQTIEAINHARAANVEIIVAINKIDKPSANPDRVKQELTEYNLLAEDWGGSTICVPVSAMKREGIDSLLEMIILVSEMKELKANPNKAARGTVVEASLDKGRGPIATILVQNGTLRVGEPIVVGSTYGKVRAMNDDKGNKLKKAGPSIPVEILGLSEVPQAGDLFYVAASERHARQVAESVVAKGREAMIKDTPKKVSLDDLFSQIQLGNVKDLNVIVKADVQGSVEALRQSLEKLSNEEVRIRVIHGGVGAVTESDVTLASASNAIIIGFNVRPEPAAKSVADEQKVDVRLYRIIYNAIEDITAAMKGMLDPIYQEKVIGHAEIRQLFKASGVGTIGGSYVTDGKFTRNAKVRVVRGGIVVYDGMLDTLKRFKDDVKEVNAGYECGLLLHKYNDIKEGDIVEAYLMEEIPR